MPLCFCEFCGFFEPLLPRLTSQLRHDYALPRLYAEGHPDLAGAQQLQFHGGYLLHSGAGVHEQMARTLSEKLNGVLPQTFTPPNAL